MSGQRIRTSHSSQQVRITNVHGAQLTMKMMDLKNFLTEAVSTQETKPSPIVGRLLSVVEVDQVAGGDGTGNGYCQGTAYSQTGGSYTQSGGTYAQAGGTYNMSCPAPGGGSGGGGGGKINLPPPENEDK